MRFLAPLGMTAVIEAPSRHRVASGCRCAKGCRKRQTAMAEAPQQAQAACCKHQETVSETISKLTFSHRKDMKKFHFLKYFISTSKNNDLYTVYSQLHRSSRRNQHRKNNRGFALKHIA